MADQNSAQIIPSDKWTPALGLEIRKHSSRVVDEAPATLVATIDTFEVREVGHTGAQTFRLEFWSGQTPPKPISFDLGAYSYVARMVFDAAGKSLGPGVVSLERGPRDPKRGIKPLPLFQSTEPIKSDAPPTKPDKPKPPGASGTGHG